MLPTVIVAIGTGIRRGDLFNLTWERIDLQRGLIDVLNSKTGRDYSVPMNKDCQSRVAGDTQHDPRQRLRFGGPALYVASPTRQTLTFRGAGADVVDLDNIGRKAGAYAARVPIAREEVSFKNGDVTLAGTLLIPAAKRKGGKHPALVFTHGGGPQLREVFWGLGYLFAAHGFVVLSYDKRGVGKSPVTGARQALKTWRMTPWRQPGFSRYERTLP